DMRKGFDSLGTGPERAGHGPVLGSRFLLSWTPRRPDQAVVGGWRWAGPVRQAAGAGALCVAARRRGRRGADADAIVDAVGRDRLARPVRTAQPELAG